jgi:hypothetical protein
MADRCVRSQLFEPHLVIMVQATLVVVDKHTRSNVLRIYTGSIPSLAYPTLTPLTAEALAAIGRALGSHN